LYDIMLDLFAKYAPMTHASNDEARNPAMLSDALAGLEGTIKACYSVYVLYRAERRRLIRLAVLSNQVDRILKHRLAPEEQRFVQATVATLAEYKRIPGVSIPVEPTPMTPSPFVSLYAGAAPTSRDAIAPASTFMLPLSSEDVFADSGALYALAHTRPPNSLPFTLGATPAALQ
jgi:hypothetical protein